MPLGVAGFSEIEPFLSRLIIFVGDYFHHVAVFKFIIKG